MKTRTVMRASFALIFLAALSCWLSYGLKHPPKLQAGRAHAVNMVRSVTAPLSITNTPAAARPTILK